MAAATLSMAALAIVAAIGFASSPGGPERGVAPAAALLVAPAHEQPDAPERLASDPTTPDPSLPGPAASGLPTSKPAAPEPPIRAAATAAPGPSVAPDPAPAKPSVRTLAPAGRDGWVCDGPVRLEDPRGRDWSLARATFQDRPGFERVLLHMERIGPGSGEPPSVTARILAGREVRRLQPRAPRPSARQTTVSLLLADGIRGNLGLRGYRPSGLRELREFSVYPSAGGASRVLVAAAPGACFRLRVPAWDRGGADTRTATIILDLRA